MSLRRKYILILVGFSLLLTAAGGWMSWRLASGALERELDEKLLWVAGAAAEVGLQSDAVLALEEGDEESLLYTSNRARLTGLLRYVDEAHIFRRGNTVLVTTDSPDLLPVGTPLRWLDAYEVEIGETWATGEAVTPLFRGEDGRFYKYGFKRLEESDAILAVLMQADYLEPLDQFRRSLVIGSIGGAALAAFLAAFLATNIVRPLERLSRAAIRIQRGRWDRAVAQESGGEVGRLARAMERMRQGIVERDEQLRLMLAQVAHEIRNPLGGLELFASAGLETEDREERGKLLERVRREVEALNEIIDDFLTFARPVHPQVRLHDVREPLTEAAELIEGQLSGNGGGLTVELPDEPLFIQGDSDHVKRVALNLLRNAGQAGRWVTMKAWWHNGEVILSIHDDGPGVSSSMKDRIFEPFVTDKEQGAGLGLAIVKRLLETNNARIELADSGGTAEVEEGSAEVGAGAEFRVYFPGSEDLPADSSHP